MNNENDRNIAILIDADNVSAKYIKSLLNEVSNHGTPTIKRIYGDWTNASMSSWKNILLAHSITPIQQYSYTTGKNATDAALIIDAMDILYSNKVDGFCIVSSDSDFTRLASRLRETGMYVLGMGEKKTPKPFISACEQFKYLEVLDRAENEEEEPNNSQSVKKDNDVRSKNSLKVAITSIVEDSSGDDGWISLSEVGSKLSRRYPDFDSRNYGYKNLSKFVRSLKKFRMELRKVPNSNKRHNYISIK